MTGYTISIGYNSSFNQNEVWNELIQLVDEVCNKPEQIIEEDGGNIPSEYAESYRKPWHDLTIVVDENERTIKQLASGSGEARQYKEQMRRAFIRIIMREMHKNNMEINVSVN